MPTVDQVAASVAVERKEFQVFGSLSSCEVVESLHFHHSLYENE